MPRTKGALNKKTIEKQNAKLETQNTPITEAKGSIDINTPLEQKTSEKNPLEDILAQYQKVETTDQNTQSGQTEATQSKTVEQFTNFLNGALLLAILDAVAPSLIVLAIEKKTGRKVRAKEIKLTEDEKKDLEPLADAFVKSFFIDLDPRYLFPIALMVMYGGKSSQYLID